MYRTVILGLVRRLLASSCSGAPKGGRRGILLADLLRPAHGEPRPLTPIRSVRIARQIAWALLLRHTKGECHGRLDPLHVLVLEAGTIDEQIEILNEEPAGARRTAGTLPFAAPEQLEGAASVDTLVDIWRFGAVVFVMLTGRPPFLAGSGKERVERMNAFRDLGPLPSTIEPRLASAPALDQLVARMLASERTRRPQSAHEVHAALAAIERSLMAGPD